MENLIIPTPQEVEEALQATETLSTIPEDAKIHASAKGKKNIVLPDCVIEALSVVLTELSKGNAVSVVSHKKEITTQEAANILNVSRPFLVKLLENGDLPFRKVGAHRRVFLEDVLKYKNVDDEKRRKTLNQLTQFSQEKKLGY